MYGEDEGISLEIYYRFLRWAIKCPHEILLEEGMIHKYAKPIWKTL